MRGSGDLLLEMSCYSGARSKPTPSYVVAGLQSLRWLMSLQTASSGCFRPVGTRSFGKLRQEPEAFDQQPVEAAATISACLAAGRTDGSAEWPAGAMRAFAWFLGENDLQTPLVDPETGSCLDGLHPDRPNENKGAESSLSYLLGLVEIRGSKRAALINQVKPAAKLVRSVGHHAVAARATPGSHLVSIPIPKAPELAPSPGSGQGRRQTLQSGDGTPRPQPDG